MENIDEERFEILRRNSLQNEVDGFFEELEDLEDGVDKTESNVTHQECLLLLRVLDRMKLPVACRASSTSEAVSVPTQKTAVKPAGNDGAIGGLVRRLTGAASEALNLAPVKRELGGAITEQECQTLADCLTPSVGGLFLLPRACSRMLKGGEAAGPSVPHRNEDTDTDNDASGQKKGPTRL